MKKAYLVLLVLILVLITAGCGSGVKNETAYQAPNKQTSVKPSPATTGNNGGQTVTPVPSTDTNAPSSTDVKLIKDLVAAAKQGKVPGCDFVAGRTNYGPVMEQWGNPDSVTYLAPKGRYAVYGSRRITVGINKGELLFEVRSFENQYKQLTRNDLTSVLGKPDSLRYYKDTTVQQDILVYNVSTNYQLIFVLPQANKNNPEPHVDHFAVVSPRDAINMMAN